MAPGRYCPARRSATTHTARGWRAAAPGKAPSLGERALADRDAREPVEHQVFHVAPRHGKLVDQAASGAASDDAQRVELDVAQYAVHALHRAGLGMAAAGLDRVGDRKSVVEG